MHLRLGINLIFPKHFDCFVSDLVGNFKDRFSYEAAQVFLRCGSYTVYFQEELCTLLSADPEEESPVLQWFQAAKNKKENNLSSCNSYYRK